MSQRTFGLDDCDSGAGSGAQASEAAIRRAETVTRIISVLSGI
jgi:hypothetical protein